MKVILSLLLACITAMLTAWFCGSLLWLSYDPINWGMTTKAMCIVLTIIYTCWIFLTCIDIKDANGSIKGIFVEIVIEAIIILAFYLTIALITFELNCFKWSIEARDIFVLMISILSFFPGNLASHYVYKRPNNNDN